MRETELAEQFPIHVVCNWICNSQAVATKHYLQVTDQHFAVAAEQETEAVQKVTETGRIDENAEPENLKEPAELLCCSDTKLARLDSNDSLVPEECSGPASRAANSDAVSTDLKALAEQLANLPSEQREALLEALRSAPNSQNR